MIGLPSLAQLDRSSSMQGMRIWLATAPADMRCGFDRLAELARRVTDQDPLGGHLFLFRSRSGDRLKALYWDRAGYALRVPVAIPPEDLQPVATARTEDKEMPRERVIAEGPAHHRLQHIESPAHVTGCGREEDPD